MTLKPTIKDILSNQYVIFSTAPHQEAATEAILIKNELKTEEILQDLGLRYLKGTGVDNEERYNPYYFVDVSSLVGSAFDKWQKVFNLLQDDLKQEIYIRGFKSQAFLMGMRFSVLGTVQDIVYHGDLPSKNYFLTDAGECFTINFKSTK